MNGVCNFKNVYPLKKHHANQLLLRDESYQIFKDYVLYWWDFFNEDKNRRAPKKKKKEKSSLLHSNEVSISVIPKSDKDGIRKENTGYSHFWTHKYKYLKTLAKWINTSEQIRHKPNIIKC